MLKLKLIPFISCIAFCFAREKRLVVFEYPDCTGLVTITFTTKMPDIVSFEPIMSRTQSFEITGCWGIYNTTNFGDWATFPIVCEDRRVCYANDFRARPAKSIRYLGPPDTLTNSISFYEGEYYKGTEVTITGLASDFPFTPKSLLTTGHTNWTLYSGSNFDGEATCFIPRPDQNYHYIPTLNPILSNVRSILKGCTPHIHHYLYGGNEEV